MAKDTYYFKHDSNARNDIKIIKLRKELGAEGYGIYFMIIEILREQKDLTLPITSIESISFDIHINESTLSKVIKDFDLFILTETSFYSSSLIKRMESYNELKTKRIAAAKKAGEASANQRSTFVNKNVDATLTQRQPLDKTKGDKSIVDKTKENNSLFVPPSVGEIENYFLEIRGLVWNKPFCRIQAENFFNHYESIGWKVGKNKMKIWKSAVSGWANRHNKDADASISQSHSKVVF